MDQVIFAHKTGITFCYNLQSLTFVGIFNIRVGNQIYKFLDLMKKVYDSISILQNFTKQMTWEVIWHQLPNWLLQHKFCPNFIVV